MSDVKRNWEMTVFVFDATDEEAEAMFDRVALAAHALDEQVTCSSGSAGEPNRYICVTEEMRAAIDLLNSGKIPAATLRAALGFTEEDAPQ